MPNLPITDLVLHFALAWHYHLANGGKSRLDGFARSWLRRVRGHGWSVQADKAIGSIIGQRNPGAALLAGLAEYDKQLGIY